MKSLGCSPQSVQSILNKHNWIEIYQKEFAKRYLALSKSNIPRRYFADKLKKHLELIFEEKNALGINWQVRKAVQKWMQISNYKAQSLILISQLSSQHKRTSKIITNRYKGIPIGPQDSTTVSKMNLEERKKWREGNIALSYTSVSNSNMIRLYISELFFCFEAYCRTLCTGSCLEFAVKSISPTVTIQHDEVYKTLKRLGGGNEDKVACQLCQIKNTCIKFPSCLEIAAVYELFYHLRVVMDYHTEIYENTGFRKYLINCLMKKSLEIISKMDILQNKLFSNYMVFPLCFEELKKAILQTTKNT